MSRYPEKLVLEPTTRCNLKCEMCVKQSAGCGIEEGDLGKEVFDGIRPLLPHLKSVVFTGIGEPLMHSGLELMISESKKLMPEGGLTGFQTNGKLLDGKRAESLVAAGVDRICISVDSTVPEQFSSVRRGGCLHQADNGFSHLSRALKNSSGNLETGVEFVLMKKNMIQLPRVVTWAAEQGASFVIVSHLTAYDPGSENQRAYLESSDRARKLYVSHAEKLAAEGVNLEKYHEILWKGEKKPLDFKVIEAAAELKKEADKQDVFIDLKRLAREDAKQRVLMEEMFEKARAEADRLGITLVLPGSRPSHNRYCRFSEENIMMVTWDGRVSPCYFLWHRYACMRDGHVKQVEPRFFGKVPEMDPVSVWNRNDYSSFRHKVKLYDYPHCRNCSLPPCSYILDAPFEQDCYTIDVPCGDCEWNHGLLNCLTL